ncbi:MAG: DUF4920 domain-containing protein, partial [Flavisolibacter sp.]
MKKIMFSAILFFALAANAQEEKEKIQAAKGVVYGTVSAEKAPVNPDEIINKLVDNKYEGQIKGKVAEVCVAEGCWIRLQKADGTTLMVKAKDHSFLMPENIVGKTVLVEGTATVKEIPESQRRHYAEDAGKSKEEIAKIKGAEK